MITKNFLLECEQYIKNGGILSGAVFTPVDIPTHEVIDPSEAEAYLKKNRDVFFVQQLLALIDKSGKKDSDVYKKAGIDRRLFSKIRSNLEYNPAKKTVLALCLALELPRPDADLLLSSAGYSLSRADDFDLAIAFCIEKQVYDFLHINEVLDHFGFELF
jgi:DNA-binding phage protein